MKLSMAGHWSRGLWVLLLAILQSQLWLGRGSLPHVWQMQNKLLEANTKLEQVQQTHARLLAQVQNLEDGLDLVEEKARDELGMIKPGELLIQWIPVAAITAPSTSLASPHRGH
jgi:cell division protein FtsB